MKRISVLEITNHFWPCVGGVENYVKQLVSRLDKSIFKVDVLCLDRCYGNKKLKGVENVGGVRIYRIPFLDLKFYKIAPKVLNFIKRYDIVHVHGTGFFSDILTMTKIFHGKPIVISTHGGIFHTRNLFFLKKLYFFVWLRFSLKFADKIIAESENNYKIFSRICQPLLIPCSIDFNFFRKKSRKREKNSLLFVGRLSPNKRVENLLHVLHQIRKEGKNMALYLVYVDWKGNEKRIKALARELRIEKNVRFLKNIPNDELLKIYKRCMFFVSASSYEGFGISVLEAMASGCVVIVNDIEAFRSFVADGKNGFIVDFSDASNAAKRIIEISKKKNLDEIRKNAIDTAARYDWNLTIKKIEKIYRSLVKRRER